MIAATAFGSDMIQMQLRLYAAEPEQPVRFRRDPMEVLARHVSPMFMNRIEIEAYGAAALAAE